MPEVEYLSYGTVEERGWNLHDEDTFEKTAEAELTREEYGSMEVSDAESILDAAEREGLGWSMKCLKGRCGRCAAVVVDGDVEMDAGQEFLAQDEVETKNMCVACVSRPETDLKLVYGVRRLENLADHVK